MCLAMPEDIEAVNLMCDLAVIAAAPQNAGTWRAHGEQSGMRYPEASDLDGGESDQQESRWPQRVKERAYKIDPECWESYSGKPKPFKQAMEQRRQASLLKAEKQVREEQS